MDKESLRDWVESVCISYERTLSRYGFDRDDLRQELWIVWVDVNKKYTPSRGDLSSMFKACALNRLRDICRKMKRRSAVYETEDIYRDNGSLIEIPFDPNIDEYIVVKQLVSFLIERLTMNEITTLRGRILGMSNIEIANAFFGGSLKEVIKNRVSLLKKMEDLLNEMD